MTQMVPGSMCDWMCLVSLWAAAVMQQPAVLIAHCVRLDILATVYDALLFMRFVG